MAGLILAGGLLTMLILWLRYFFIDSQAHFISPSLTYFFHFIFSFSTHQIFLSYRQTNQLKLTMLDAIMKSIQRVQFRLPIVREQKVAVTILSSAATTNAGGYLWIGGKDTHRFCHQMGVVPWWNRNGDFLFLDAVNTWTQLQGIWVFFMDV